MKKLPHQISEYLLNRFKDGYVSHVKTVNNKDGNLRYTVMVNEDETIHQLQFDEEGKLIDHTTGSMFDDDYHRESSHGLGLHGLDDY